MNTTLQNIIPQHFLSRLLGRFASARLGCLTRWGIKKFIQHYAVDMREAKIKDYREFTSFNEFFTRELAEGARPLCTDRNAIISPVDGCVSECGTIQKDQLLQAKGSYYSLSDLLAGDALCAQFENGAFLTAYLAPKDYHRFHMPITGKLLKMIYVPGKLFSVNQAAANQIPGLFAKNERVICIFETEIGKLAYIAVGAMIVASIGMKWHGIVAPQRSNDVMTWDYSNQNIVLARGDEMGHFQLGSTVIMLLEKDRVTWKVDMQAEKVLRMGVKIGEV